MSVIIRLQNLPWSANAADIRQYFQGLSIPKGGVYIIGGEKGIAFILFSTDEDARQAILFDGGFIKNVQIRLLLSSRNEMRKFIETVRQYTTTQITQVYMHQMQQPQHPLIGSSPPLIAKVLSLPQQQSRPNQLVTMLQRQPPSIDSKAVFSSQDKQEQLQQQLQQHRSLKSTEAYDRDDKSSYKRERIRSKYREHRSRLSQSSESNRQDRSRSGDRHHSDRSREREEDNGDGQSSAKKRKNDEDTNNPMTCDKNPSADDKRLGGDGDEEQQSSATLQQQQQNAPTKYLKLKQLPMTVTEEEVLNEMNSGGEVRRVTFYPDGEFMGAALEFHSVDEAETTLKRFDCVLLGSTPVPVLRCTYKEYVQIVRKPGDGTKRFPGENTSGGGGGVGSGGRHYNHQHHNPVPVPAQPSIQPNVAPTGGRSNCVYVHGLPMSVTNTDVMRFFADTTALPDKIHIVLSKFGRPTGESYCAFSTVQQAHMALIKDHCYMGPNLVHVSPINRSDMIQAITKLMQQHNHHQNMSWGPGGGSSNRGGGGGLKQHYMMFGPSMQQHQRPQYSGGGHNGGYGGGRPHPYMNNARGGGGYNPWMRGPGPNSGPDGFGQPGCVVAMDNVPYSANVQQILNFFSGFEFDGQNVIRRFNDFGKPTGEVRVNFRNPQEAMRVVHVLQNKPIFNRPVRLTLL